MVRHQYQAQLSGCLGVRHMQYLHTDSLIPTNKASNAPKACPCPLPAARGGLPPAYQARLLPRPTSFCVHTRSPLCHDPPPLLRPFDPQTMGTALRVGLFGTGDHWEVGHGTHEGTRTDVSLVPCLVVLSAYQPTDGWGWYWNGT
jgi:hypothetical protein